MKRFQPIVCLLVALILAPDATGAPQNEPLSLDTLPFARSEVFGADTAQFEVDGHKAFLVRPPRQRADGSRPWIWYAPTLADGAGGWKLPGARHARVVKPLLEAGCYFCGVDVGESYGSPAGRKVFTAFYHLLTDQLGLARQACLFPVSRGGLMHYNWAAEHPDCVRCIGAIYPVCNLTSYPGLDRLSAAYGIAPAKLRLELGDHNPVDRLAPLAEQRVPILHLQGDKDTAVPLEANSEKLAARYRALGGPIELIVVPGKGHEIVPEFWENPRLAEFYLECLETGTPSGRGRPRNRR